MAELKLQQSMLDGRYVIRDCLGRGSYSEVYVADDLAASNGSPRTVVIKALNTNLQGVPDPELERTLVENFRNEAIALDRVRHPNIISRLGHGTAIDLQGRTFHYLVLEYLPGGDLQALVLRNPLPLDGALFYLEQVCAGLAHAHRHGVIHRDIKPQNLLLTADQRTVKIADFGVAKIEAGEGLITRVGTEVYAAPEHHPLATTGPLDTSSLTRRVIQLTPAADIYSLAKTTYMLLTGESPRRFSQRPVTALPEQFAGEEWARYVLRVLERATQRDPAKRHQTVEEFWRDIRDATMTQTRPLRKSDGGEGAPPDQNNPGSPPVGNHGGGPSRGNSAGALGGSPGGPAGESLSGPAGGTSVGKTGARAFALPPPPAPTFDRDARPLGGTARHRIVVPVASAGEEERAARFGAQLDAPGEAAPFAAAQDGAVGAGVGYAGEYAFPVAGGVRLSSRARRWLVALLLLLTFSGMLYATYRYVNNLRHPPSVQQQQQTSAAGGGFLFGGREFVTTTDVNLRSGPDTSYDRVGLAENGSRVKVLKVSGKWYQVQVTEHARAPTDSDSKDQGWLNSTLLKAQ
jgi:serine/threonine protein kinase